MSMLFADSPTSVALWIVIKASALLAVTALVQAILGQRVSAATRHRIWMLGLTSTLVLPAVSATLPQWPIAIHVAPKSAEVGPVTTAIDAPSVEVTALTPLDTSAQFVADAQPAFTLSWSTAIAGAYLVGVAGLLMLVALQRWALSRLAGSCTIVHDPEWIRLLKECADALGVDRPVRLLRSRERNVPMAFGTRVPSIVIPSIADTWADDRRRAVVLHELAHVARYDCLTQTMTAAASAMYWFHPAVWWVARRVRIERELACDDRVITVGTGPREYAGHLLEIAYSFGGHRAPALAVTMARPRQLEGRMLAALDAARNRRLPSLRARLTLAAAAIVLLVSVAVAKPATTSVTSDEPPAPSGPWPIADERPDSVSAAGKLTEQQLKDISQLPLRGLQELRGGVRAAAAAFGIPQENAPGTWEIRPTETKGMVHLRIVETNSSSGTNVPIEQLEGLTGVQLTGAGGPVQFKVRRDAGTFTFEGVVRNGVGAGTFSFTPDPNFPAELAKRGFDRPTALEQYQLARHDVGFAFVEELSRQGYAKPKTADLVRAGQHGVQAIYLREMGALGYRLGSLDPLIMLRDHGITPTYVREMAEQGYKGLSAEDIRQARDHGITPDYVRGMRDGGYGSVPLTELVNLRDHGITPEFIRELGNAGYSKLPLDQLLRVRDHGVSPDYVRGMKGLGYSLAPEELVRARDHGVTVEYVRDMAALGYADQPMDTLIRVRDHGVTPDYARELKTLGYDKLSLDELVTLRDHGLTADRIRAANTRAGTKLPIDMLRSLAAGGMR